MTEYEIFLKAVEISDPVEREKYIEEACSGDAELKAQVTTLLTAHQEASQFLQTPAMSELRGHVKDLQGIHRESDNEDGHSVASDETTIQQEGEGDDDSEAGMDDGDAIVEEEFRRHLLPATRSGWLGRLGHYEIEEILGHGAFGIVAKAFDEKLHRVVAIKMLRPEFATTSPPRKRFLREARSAAAVLHENIVAIYAVEEEPIPYLVTEYVPGQTLHTRLNSKGPLEATEVLQIAVQIASGLAAAHKAGLIHRDIKPANVLLMCDPVDRAKISDFGLARAVDDASLTRSGVIAGTPLYMAPEQARAEPLDHRATCSAWAV
ncbi:MAG: hypothetical protein ACI9R3_006285 [Verrucomicrobiales bacterium]|jgi:hypothetical protein